MFFEPGINLLPWKIEAKNYFTSSSTTSQLFKTSIVKKLFKIIKASLVLIMLGGFLGYQPAPTFPPLKRAAVKAEAADFSVTPKVAAGKLASGFSLPHPGYISTKFSFWHPGIDIAMGLGTPIHPISPGVVTEVTYGFFGLGHSVVIVHQDGFKSTYGHMGRIFVKVDDHVSPTSIIGEIGLTGHTSGPHTHLEITKDDKYVNPETLLPSLSDYPAAEYFTNPGYVPPIGGSQLISNEQAKPVEIKLDLKRELKVSL